ncbi:amidase [Microbacterium sp.]|uniref:amidase n=1 Tax=Microbacterium sp. TaxID=51671 RepID=UPI0031FE66A4|nr:amidase [Microbacterium sp.]
MTLHEAARGLRERRFSSVELTQACLDRVADLDDRIGAFVAVTPDEAMNAANAADRSFTAGRATTRLTGIPIGVKDIIDTASVRTTANSHVWHDRVPRRDASVVARLKRSGAVGIGKLQTNEFAIGRVGDGDLQGPPRNPWRLDRSTGGSSSGPAAAVAAGMCFGAIGTDTGGSIRAPASHCGVVGLKPTVGRVSRHGVAMLSWTLDHVGPLARSTADVAVILERIAGRDRHDRLSSRRRVPSYESAMTGSVDGLKIGVPEAYLATVDLQEDVVASFRDSVTALQRSGAAVGPVEFPALPLSAVLDPIVLTEAASIHHVRLSRGEPYGRGFLERMALGLTYSGVDYAHALRGRAKFIADMRRLMKTVDLLVMPTMSVTAPPQDTDIDAVRSPFTGHFNVSGQPAITIPCGRDRDGLPIGLHLVGRWFDEATVLRAARVCEKAFGPLSPPWARGAVTQ